ncbi:MAG: GAF domain-containing protein [Cytophagales bacterium]|nr:GAF domain-containing protein [Armatimonadota bacterium]
MPNSAPVPPGEPVKNVRRIRPKVVRLSRTKGDVPAPLSLLPAVPVYEFPPIPPIDTELLGVEEAMIGFAAVAENERRERQLWTLYELWRAVPQNVELNRLLQMIVERVTSAMDAHTCSLMTRERGGDTLRVVASVGLPQDVAESVTLMVGERIAGRVAATGQPILVNKDPNNHPLLRAGSDRDPELLITTRPEVESAVCAPLVGSDGVVLGVLCLSRHAPAVPFNESDLRVFSLFASQAGSVIAQAQMRDTLHQRQRELASLAQVTEAIRARVSEQVLLERLARGVLEVMGLDRCQIWRRTTRASEPGAEESAAAGVPPRDLSLSSGSGRAVWSLAFSRGFGAGPMHPVVLPPALQHLTETCFLGRPEPVEASAASARSDAAMRTFLEAYSIEAGVAAPILVQGGCDAVVIADMRRGANARVREEIAETLSLFASHISVAIENARLVESLTRASEESATMEREISRNAQLAALGQLAATVAHELRNPLSSIKGAAQYLLRECEDSSKNVPASMTDFLSIVVDEVDGLGRLTTDLLDFAGPATPRRVRCDLAEIAQGEVAFLRAELEAMGVEQLRESYKISDPALVDVDATQIGQALRNLLLNAGQAIAERNHQNSGDETTNASVRAGRLVVSLRAVPGGAPAAYMLTVDDNGSGVAPGSRNRLWEPFYTTKARGTGLGLSQVRQAAEAHGGTATIDEVPGDEGGTRFTLCLPAARTDTPPPTPGILPGYETDPPRETGAPS